MWKDYLLFLLILPLVASSTSNSPYRYLNIQENHKNSEIDTVEVIRNHVSPEVEFFMKARDIHIESLVTLLMPDIKDNYLGSGSLRFPGQSSYYAFSTPLIYSIKEIEPGIFVALYSEVPSSKLIYPTSCRRELKFKLATLQYSRKLKDLTVISSQTFELPQHLGEPLWHSIEARIDLKNIEKSFGYFEYAIQVNGNIVFRNHWLDQGDVYKFNARVQQGVINDVETNVSFKRIWKSCTRNISRFENRDWSLSVEQQNGPVFDIELKGNHRTNFYESEVVELLIHYGRNQIALERLELKKVPMGKIYRGTYKVRFGPENEIKDNDYLIVRYDRGRPEIPRMEVFIEIL